MESLLHFAGTGVARVAPGSLVWIPSEWHHQYAIVSDPQSKGECTHATFLTAADDTFVGQYGEIGEGCVCIDFGCDFIFSPQVTSSYADRIEEYANAGIGILDGEDVFIVVKYNYSDEFVQLMNMSTGAIRGVPDHKVIKFPEWSIGVRSAEGDIRTLCEFLEPKEVAASGLHKRA